MRKLRPLLLAAALALPATAAWAEDSARPQEPVSAGLSSEQRQGYREVFAAIRASDWLGASARLAALPEGPLHNAARAELFLAKGSPKVELPELLELLRKAPEMPKAEQIARLAETRGATELPGLPAAERLVWVGSQPRRARAEATKGDPAAAELEPLVQPLIKDNRPYEAEAVFIERQDRLGADARTEYQQRIAWSYYIVGNDRDARRLAALARSGTSEWAIQGAWSEGLAAWREGDCKGAADAFGHVAGRSGDVELVAAAHYWSARAEMMCGKPERVQGHLRSAARQKETFYGLIATTALGISGPGAAGLHNYRDSEWRGIAGKPNVRAALALAEIGEADLADQFLRHQARIGGAGDHNALLHLAADLNLAGAQYWLAHNAPRGASVNFAARYPRPDWQPTRGWRVDPSLAFAHALQESNFRTSVVSPAGAVGLMQVRPGTAGDIARARGEPFDRQLLTSPAANIEFGQSYIESLRDNGATGGLLPKVIAAYNAGPVPVAEWNARRFDKGDPLLYIESLPYWETRGYVPIVLRNYWIYEEEAGKPGPSRAALAQGLWPKFPGMAGASAVRLKVDETKLAYGTE
ncbi:MAG TPA: lytic transglycosylase domain-containing protein [Allosphingosinicella sp.]|jgi:soluble lytic murein transglycosylase-like protein|nr:lytic transglycosylase domain-containing protein [Allosphingosinicella sp.]